MSRRIRYAFGPYELEPETGTLWREGRMLSIQPQRARALELLVRRAGEVVTREELRDALWGADTYVDYEQGINSCIRGLRRRLRDDAKRVRYVQTVSARGYRFIAPVTLIEPEAGPERVVAPSAGVEGWADPPRRRPATLRMAVVLAALLALLALALILGWMSRRRVSEAERAGEPPVRLLLPTVDDRIVDPLLRGSIDVALRAGLQRYPFLRVLPIEEAEATLERMDAGRLEPTDRAVQVELARRSNAAVLVSVRALELGGEYLFAAEIVDPEAGTTISAFDARASRRDDVLPALDRLTDRLVEELSSASVAASFERPPLAQVTTSNLEALKAYSAALGEWEAGDLEKALFLLRGAVELDPEFAMARAKLGAMWRSLDRFDEATEQLEAARASPARLTPRERLYVDAWLATIEPDPERALELWTQMSHLYPDDWVGHYNLAQAYWLFFADFESCAETFAGARGTVGPRRRPYFVAMEALCRTALGEAASAGRLLDEVLAHGEVPAPVRPLVIEVLIALGRHQEAGRLIEEMSADRLHVSSRSLRLLALLDVDRGDWQAAAGRFRQAVERYEAEPGAHREIAARIWELLSLQESGATGAVPDRLRAAIERASPLDAGSPHQSFRRQALALLGVIAVRAGDLETARRLADELPAAGEGFDPLRPSFGLVQALRAEIALAEGRPEEALGIAEHTVREVPTAPFQAYDVLARARLATGAEEGASEVRRYLAEHRGAAFVRCAAPPICLEQLHAVAAYRNAAAALAP